MAGITLVLDLLKRKHSSSLHSHGVFSAAAAASAAATVYVAAGKPLASRFSFGDGRLSIAYCDAGAALSEDYIPNLRTASESIFHHDSIIYRTKEYPLELKPLFSAFTLKSLAITSIRSFLLFYLPLLEPRSTLDDDDFLKDELEDKPDFIVPFQNSVKQILRETTVVTTRRFLERIAVYHVSQRMAWKLLKDVSKSAKRKAARGMSTSCFVSSVSRTTFRGHMLGVAASWVVQIMIDFYRCFLRKSATDDEITDAKQRIRLYGKKDVLLETMQGRLSLFSVLRNFIWSFDGPTNQSVQANLPVSDSPWKDLFSALREVHLEMVRGRQSSLAD